MIDDATKEIVRRGALAYILQMKIQEQSNLPPRSTY
jgi:hypothetical protein